MQSFKQYYRKDTITEAFFPKTRTALSLAGMLALAPYSGKAALTNDPIASYITKHEGIRYKAYPDTKNLTSIGIGHLLVPSDKQLFKQLFGPTIDYDKIVTGKQAFTPAQVQKLFTHDLKTKQAIALRRYPKFSAYPHEIKAALLDSIFRGEQHPRTDALINAGKWQEAAAEYLKDAEYIDAKKLNTGVAKRMEQNAATFNGYKPVSSNQPK